MHKHKNMHKPDETRFNFKSPERLLLEAARYNNFQQLMNQLIKKPECVNYQDNDGRTAAMYATMNGNIQCLEILADQKLFNPSIVDHTDRNILSYTLSSGDIEFARKVYQIMYPLDDEK